MAALASVSAFAQSSVTIDGYFDRGAIVTNNTNSAKSAKGVGSNAGTTTIGIKGVEDLGGGMKVGFSVNTDWSDLAGTNQDSTATTASSIQTGGFANSQSYLEFITANLGKVQAGSINNEVLTNATSIASPAFSTGVGSAYSSSWSIHSGMGTGTTGSGGIVTLADPTTNTYAGVRGIRQANTIKYVSPNVMGFTFSYGAAAQNEQGTAGTGKTVGVTDMSLRYTNGPVDVMYSSLQYKVGSVAPLNGSLVAGANNKLTLLGASYQVLPTLKLHAGSGASTSSGLTNAVDATSKQYGVTWNATPVIDVLAQVASVNDKTTNDKDRKMTGLGVDYKFSKTARAYLRYDSLNLSANTTASGSEIKRTAIGVSKSF